MAKKFLTPITPPALGSDPVSGNVGSIYYNTSTNTLKFYNGSTWTEIGGTGNASLNITSSYANNPTNGDLVYNTSSDKMAFAYNNVWREMAYQTETQAIDGGSSVTTDFDLVLDGGGSSTGTFINTYYP